MVRSLRTPAFTLVSVKSKAIRFVTRRESSHLCLSGFRLETGLQTASGQVEAAESVRPDAPIPEEELPSKQEEEACSPGGFVICTSTHIISLAGCLREQEPNQENVLNLSLRTGAYFPSVGCPE